MVKDILYLQYTATESARRRFQGVQRYMAEHGGWNLNVVENCKEISSIRRVVKYWHPDGCIADCKSTGEIRTLYGRRRSVPEIHASQFMVRQLGERLAMNTPIQGTAADIIKLAMIRTAKALKEQCPEAELILQIHDELILRVPKEKEEQAKKILKESMENAACLDVKLDVDLNIGHNWYELK